MSDVLHMRELSMEEVDAVGGAGDMMDAILLGASTGALIGGMAGLGSPGAIAAGGLIGGAVAFAVFMW